MFVAITKCFKKNNYEYYCDA